MSPWPASPMKQLSVVWLATVLLEAALVVPWGTRRPQKAFWLIPYPTWRTVTPMFVQLFRASPRLGLALMVPAVALLASVAIVVAAVVGHSR